MSLPTPVGRQREVLYLPGEGHFVVLGTAGSAKTTLAVLRSAYLSHPGTKHRGKCLLVTFNRALVTYLRHIKEEELGEVVIENYHTFARGYLASRGKLPWNSICPPRNREIFVREAVAEGASDANSEWLRERSLDFFSEEIAWISQHGFEAPEDYEAAERIGRSETRVARGDQRDLVWRVYQNYRRIRSERGWIYDWDDIASAVRRELEDDSTERRYRHVVIDEGQDFSPEMIRSLALAVPPDGSVTLFGDMAQQIYGRRISWRSAGLEVSRVWEFKDNYRNTKQIADLALAISDMAYFTDVPDLVAPSTPRAAGPLPTLVQCASESEELDLVVAQGQALARTGTVAILVRKTRDERRLGSRLPRTAIRLHRDLATWGSGAGLYYGTLHSAKGLEFDSVIVPFASEARLPDSELIENVGASEADFEDGKLLYVGVTRAKTRLILTAVGEFTHLLPQIPQLYEVVSP